MAALILAIRSADMPLVAGAPSFLAADFWSYLPFLLVTVSGGMMLYRTMQSPNPGRPSPNPPLAGPVAPVSAMMEAHIKSANIATEKLPTAPLLQDRDYLPARFVAEFYALLHGPHTDLQTNAMLRPHIGQWARLSGIVYEVRPEVDGCMMTMYPSDECRDSIRVLFEAKWTPHLARLNPKQRIEIDARISDLGYSTIKFTNGELL